MTSLGGRVLIVRADASSATGTGHLMRSLALAQAWLDGGGRVRWLLAAAPESLVARIAAEGIAIEQVDAEPGGHDDAARLRDALATESTAVAAIDGEIFQVAYLDALGDAGARVLYVDDMALLPRYPVGFVLNQNAHADRAEYPPDAIARFLLGLRYVMLRREFRATTAGARVTPDHARRVLVSFGGSDPSGMTERTLAAIRDVAKTTHDLDVRALVGAANPAAERIAALAAAPDLDYRLCVERSVSDMPARIAWADLAVVSGGSTVWELARLGCPALVVETVPAEVRLAGGLAMVGLFGRLGAASELSDATLAAEVAAKLEDRGWREEMSRRGARLVDGQGARRVAEVIAGDNGSTNDDERD